MIHFFRIIRQKLLMNPPKDSPDSGSNTFGRYLLYAIGEIFLVVIGILIALQINNWNEGRKDRDLRISYITGFISDLEYDIRAYTIGIEEIEEHRKSTDALLLCYKNNTTLPDSALIEHMTSVGKISRFSHRNTVMDDMKSAGRLNLISEDSVRQRIVAYYKLASGVVDNNDRLNDWILDHIIGSRVYSEQFDFNSTVAATRQIPDIMKSIEVTPFDGLPLIEDPNHPDREQIINLLTAKNWLEGLNKLNGLNARREAIALKEMLQEHLSILKQ